MSRSNGPYMHLRSGVGIAMCGLPAKQEHLSTGWDAVTCPHCHRRAVEAAPRMRAIA